MRCLVRICSRFLSTARPRQMTATEKLPEFKLSIRHVDTSKLIPTLPSRLPFIFLTAHRRACTPSASTTKARTIICQYLHLSKDRCRVRAVAKQIWRRFSLENRDYRYQVECNINIIPTNRRTALSIWWAYLLKHNLTISNCLIIVVFASGCIVDSHWLSERRWQANKQHKQPSKR